jgi:hypothetical protein
MNFELINTDTSVIQRLSDDWIGLQEKMFKAESLVAKIHNSFNASRGAYPRDEKGNKLPGSLPSIPVEILREGGQWQKGTLRVKLAIEFCPEPEHALNGFRSEPLERVGDDQPSILEDSNWPPQ